MKKRGEPSDNSESLLPPLSYSLLQPLWEHAGRLKRDSFCLMLAFETLNISSWVPSQPKDELLNIKAVQSLFNSIELSWRGGLINTVRFCVKLSNFFLDFLNLKRVMIWKIFSIP